ncbi:hypothetical protein LCGC14_0142200 [marine sediment metagenome]|uniref:Uncharacterized protein n=1 Tax=marine sediment metagenome TaxID=412755 RepID=A0A0F9V172_9ZZZZ
MRLLKDSNNSMLISTGQTTITYTYCDQGILTEITHPPNIEPIHSLTRPIKQHKVFCDELQSALKDNRDYFEVFLSGYLFIVDQGTIKSFIDWFSQLPNTRCLDCHGTGRVPMLNRDIDCDCVKD